MDLTEKVEQILKANFYNITKNNGFDNDIVLVETGFKDVNNVTQFPSICFYNLAEDRAKRTGLFNFNLNLQYGILIFFSDLSDTLENNYTSLKKDLKNLIHSTNCTLNNIDGINYGNWILDKIEPFYDFEMKRGFVGARLTINEILEDKTSSDPISVPGISNFTLPSNGAVNQNQQINFAWTSTTGAASYQIQVATDLAFTNLVINQPFLVENNYTNNLNDSFSNGATYYAKVRGLNAGGYGNWSPTISFSVMGGIPAIPTLSTTGYIFTTNQELNWNTSVLSTGYDLQLASDTGFNSVIESATNLQTTNYTLTSTLSGDTVYFYKVRGTTNSVSSNFSNYNSLTSYAQEAITYFNKIGTLSYNNRSYVNTLIKNFKSYILTSGTGQNFWSASDAIYWLGCPSGRLDALLNLKQDAISLQTVQENPNALNGIWQVPYQGVTGNTNVPLRTNWQPGLALVGQNASFSSNAIGVYYRVSLTASGMLMGGYQSTNELFIYDSRVNNELYCGNFCIGSYANVFGTMTGMLVNTRLGFTDYKVYRNGNKLYSPNNAQSISAWTGYSQTIGSAGSVISFAFISSGLSSNDVSQISTYINTFMTQTGVNVY